MKHTMKKTFAMLLAACCLIAGIGCAVSTGNKQSVDASAPGDMQVVTVPSEQPSGSESWVEPWIEPETPFELTAQNEPEQVSEERIMELFWQLFDEMKTAAQNGDYDDFRALYYETDESVIENDFRYNWNQYDDYDRRDGFVMGNQDGYYGIVYTFYTVSGSHPNTRRSSVDGSMCAHYENGRLQLAYGTDAVNMMNELSMEVIYARVEQVYPEFRSELESTVNFGNFTNFNSLFLNSAMVYDGSYDTSLLYLWQTPDGSVKALIWYANGTDVNIGTYQTRLTVTDDSLGTIISEQFNETVSIRAHHSLIRVFTVPADRVMSGTQTWTSMHADCGTSY